MIRRILAVARVTVLETLWRKHVYVLLLLIAGVYYFFGRMEFFDLGAEATFVKLIPITAMALFGVIVATFAAARQVPDEIAQRTIFPLLAKPLTRFEFLLGKFVGTASVLTVAMMALAGVFFVLLASKGVALDSVFWQAIVLQVLAVWVYLAVVLALSTFFSYAATVVLAFLLFYLFGSAGSTLEDLLFVGALPHGLEWFYKGILWLLPRLDLFNISKAVLHEGKPLPWTIVLPFLAYSCSYCIALLFIASIAFRRKDL